MKISSKVNRILQHYRSDSENTRKNLATILMHGKLGGTGKMVILPVDQGFEHGPERSFSINPEAYDPCYHMNLAIKAGLNAFAAPLGMLETCYGQEGYNTLPKILKINSANSLSAAQSPAQAITASVDDAIRLGCNAIGLTIYPGSNSFNDSMKDVSAIIREAKSKGLVAVVWSYPRGEGVSKNGETAIDVISYSAHIAALIGAHIIKVKLPTDFVEQNEAKKAFEKGKCKYSSIAERVAMIKKSCFAGKRLVVFSGGAAKSDSELLDEIKAIHVGGGDGSIIGRNAFQRNKNDAIKLLDQIVNVYK